MYKYIHSEIVNPRLLTLQKSLKLRRKKLEVFYNEMIG